MLPHNHITSHHNTPQHTITILHHTPFRGEGIECLHDLDSYAGWGFLLLVGSPKPDRLKGRGQTKQHRPLAGTQMLSLHRCAFLPGGLFSGFRLRACNLCIPLEWSGRGKSSESHVYSVDNVFTSLPFLLSFLLSSLPIFFLHSQTFDFYSELFSLTVYWP